MRKIPGNIFSHNSVITKKRESVESVAKSIPLRVKSFDELIEVTSEISYQNREYFPFYRGQDREYYTASNKPQSRIITSFNRPPKGKKILSSKVKNN